MRKASNLGLMGMNAPFKVTDLRYLVQISPPKKFKIIPRKTTKHGHNTFISELPIDLSGLLSQRIGAATASQAGTKREYENDKASNTVMNINIVKCFELKSRIMVDPATKSAVAKYKLKKPSFRQNDKRAGLRAKSRPPKTNKVFEYFRDLVGMSLSPIARKNENVMIPIARRYTKAMAQMSATSVLPTAPFPAEMRLARAFGRIPISMNVSGLSAANRKLNVRSRLFLPSPLVNGATAYQGASIFKIA